MIITDKIYGRFDINEPVLIELLKSPAVLRLKNISQHGVPGKYYGSSGYSRYYHSLGVMLALRRLGASLEEQVAGLIHDASHLAFSHVADWVFADGHKGKEDYHDLSHDQFIRKTEIPQILSRYGLDTERILSENNFPLLENKLPDICADRLDYTLQEMYRSTDKKIAGECLNGVINFKNEIVFKSKNIGLLFAKNYLRLQRELWGGENDSARYNDFSEILKDALQKGIIDRIDFYEDEEKILAKLESSSDGETKDALKIMTLKNFLKIREKRGLWVRRKFRYVDPKVLIDGKIKRVNELYPEFGKKIEREKIENEKGILV